MTTIAIMIIIGTPTPRPIPNPIAKALFSGVSPDGACALHDSYTVTGPMLVKFVPLVPEPQSASSYYYWVKVKVYEVAPETVSPLDNVLPVLEVRVTLVISWLV